MDLQRPAPLPSLWRNRDYVLLWTGQMVSQLGSGVSQIAYPLVILALTHSAANAGIAAALHSLPYLIFSLPAGALLDRWDRKRVMIICDAGRAIALGSIPVAYALGHLTLAQLYITAAAEGSLYVLFDIAEAACLPRVVPGPQVPSASAQNEAGTTAALLIAPALGGGLFAVARSLPFAVDAVSYLASVLSLNLIETTFQEDRTAEHRSLAADIAEGIAWLWRHRLIRYMAFLTGGLVLIDAAAFLPVIVLAQQQNASAPTIGLILSIASGGGLVGALVAPRIQRSLAFGRVIVGTLWIVALAYPLMAVAPNPILLGLFLGVFLATSPIYDAVQFSYRVRSVSDQLQGRVNSAFRLIGYGFQPIGAAMSGVLIASIGARQTVLVFAAVGLALALVTTGNSEVRNARPVATKESPMSFSQASKGPG